MAAPPPFVDICTLCGLPTEYCEYNTEVPHPKPAAAAAAAVTEKLASLAVEGGKEGEAPQATPAGDAPPAAAADAAGEGEVKKKSSGKKQSKKQVTVERATRNKRKCVTSVLGLELFGVKLAEAAKKFGKKFACGASVVKDASNKEQIDVQGDCMDELVEFLVKEYGPSTGITLDDCKTIDHEKK